MRRGTAFNRTIRYTSHHATVSPWVVKCQQAGMSMAGADMCRAAPESMVPDCIVPAVLPSPLPSILTTSPRTRSIVPGKKLCFIDGYRSYMTGIGKNNVII